MNLVELGTVATIIAGQSPPSSTYNTLGHGLPFFQGKAEFGDLSPTPVKWCTDPTKVAERGDILISVRAPVGPTNIAADRCCVGRGLAAIRPDPNRADRDFVNWALVAARPMLERKGNGSTFLAINRSDLAALRIPFPPLDEQRRIVGLLDRAAEIRRRADAARAKARAIIPALFLDTFGDPATNPKRWPVAELGNHADVQGGVQVSAKRATLPVELPYLRVANVMRGRLDLSEIKMIRVTASEVRRTSLIRGDILVVEGHGNPNEIGRAAVWDGSIAACTHQNHLIRVRPNFDSLTPEYVETFLNSDIGRRILIQNGKTTSGLNTISTRNVKEVRVPLPPTDLQAVFAEQVQCVEVLARHLDAAATKAEAMAAGLSAEVFGASPQTTGRAA